MRQFELVIVLRLLIVFTSDLSQDRGVSGASLVVDQLAFSRTCITLGLEIIFRNDCCLSLESLVLLLLGKVSRDLFEENNRTYEEHNKGNDGSSKITDVDCGWCRLDISTARHGQEWSGNQSELGEVVCAARNLAFTRWSSLSRAIQGSPFNLTLVEECAHQIRLNVLLIERYSHSDWLFKVLNWELLKIEVSTRVSSLEYVYINYERFVTVIINGCFFVNESFHEQIIIGSEQFFVGWETNLGKLGRIALHCDS